MAIWFSLYFIDTTKVAFILKFATVQKRQLIGRIPTTPTKHFQAANRLRLIQGLFKRLSIRTAVICALQMPF
jgi:hypothetical protein